MADTTSVIPAERVQRGILTLRGQRVMLDVDLAELYGVTTRRLNEQVKRNVARFPREFMFQLTEVEKKEVVANCDHLQKIKYSPVQPYAFTEYGAIMLASILNSPVAVQASIQVVKAFVALRQLTAEKADLLKRVDAMEKKYDARFRIVFDAIRKLMAPEPKSKKRIGF
ncbi:MAG TPA: ORF6N domain-containing protein [Kiritimatiellia bacterium]